MSGPRLSYIVIDYLRVFALVPVIVSAEENEES
jgi:hypothetical protein